MRTPTLTESYAGPSPDAPARSRAGWLVPLAFPVVIALSGVWAPWAAGAVRPDGHPDSATLPVSRSRSEPRDDDAERNPGYAASERHEKSRNDRGRADRSDPPESSVPSRETQRPAERPAAGSDTRREGAASPSDRATATGQGAGAEAPDGPAGGTAVHIGGEGVDTAPGGDPNAAGTGSGGGSTPPATVPAARRRGPSSPANRSGGGGDGSSRGSPAGGAFSDGPGSNPRGGATGAARRGPGQGTTGTPGVPFGPGVPPPVRSPFGSGVSGNAAVPFHAPGATLLSIPVTQISSAATVASERIARRVPLPAPARPLARTGGETSASTMLAMSLIVAGAALRRMGRQTSAPGYRGAVRSRSGGGSAGTFQCRNGLS